MKNFSQECANEWVQISIEIGVVNQGYSQALTLLIISIQLVAKATSKEIENQHTETPTIQFSLTPTYPSIKYNQNIIYNSLP